MLNTSEYHFQVTCVGDAIGAVIAETKHAAVKAAKAVKIEYENLPPIITIEVRFDKNNSVKFLRGLSPYCPHLAMFASLTRRPEI